MNWILTCDWLAVLAGTCGLRAGVREGDGWLTTTWREESTPPPAGGAGLDSANMHTCKRRAEHQDGTGNQGENNTLNTPWTHVHPYLFGHVRDLGEGLRLQKQLCFNWLWTGGNLQWLDGEGGVQAWFHVVVTGAFLGRAEGRALRRNTDTEHVSRKFTTDSLSLLQQSRPEMSEMAHLR